MKLRTTIVALATLVTLIGAVTLLAGRVHPGLQLLAFGVLGLLATVFEQWRYRKRLPPSARWQTTGERFDDPSTGEPMEVLYDPDTGERRYVPLEQRPR